MDPVSKAGYRPLASESKRVGSSSSADQRLQRGGSSLKKRGVRWTVASCNLWGHPVQINRSGLGFTLSRRDVKCARPDTQPPDTTEISEADFIRPDGLPHPAGEWVREMEDPSTQKLPLYGILCSAHERLRLAPDAPQRAEIAARTRDALFTAFAPALRDAEAQWLQGWTEHETTLVINAFEAVRRFSAALETELRSVHDRLLKTITFLTFHEYARDVTREEDVIAWAKLLYNLWRPDPLGALGGSVVRVRHFLARLARGPVRALRGGDPVGDSVDARRVKQQRHTFVKARLSVHFPTVLADIVCKYSDAPPVDGECSYWLDDLDLRTAAEPAPAREPTPKEDVQTAAELNVDGRVCPAFVMDRKSDAKGRYRVGVSLNREAERLMELCRFQAIWDDALSYPPKQFWVPQEFLE